MTASNREVYRMPIQTADGEFTACYSATGLAGLFFPGRSDEHPSTNDAPSTVKTWHKATVSALESALAGKPVKALPPMDWTSGTGFQQSVWRVLAGIKPGRTLSYGEVAAAIGKPGAMRAVGQACGANPIPVLVPCHRVLAANARIGGFSGGMDWKVTLLQREGVGFKLQRTETV